MTLKIKALVSLDLNVRFYELQNSKNYNIVLKNLLKEITFK